MMSDREFMIELCNRLLEVREKWIEAHCNVIRAKAEEDCARAKLRMLEAQIETAKLRDRLIEEQVAA